MDILSEDWVGPVEGGIILTDILFEELALIQKQQTRMEYYVQLVNCQFLDPWLTCVNKWMGLKNKWPFLDLLGKQLRKSNLIRCLLALMESGIQFTCYVKSTIAMLAHLTDAKARKNLIKELLDIVIDLKLDSSDWYFAILKKAGYIVVENDGSENKVCVPPIENVNDIPARKRFFATLTRIKLKENPIYFQKLQQNVKDKEEILTWLESFEYISESIIMELRNLKSKNEDFNKCLDYFFQTINFRYKFKDQERYEEWLKSQMREARPKQNLTQQLIQELEIIEENLGKNMEMEQNVKKQNMDEVNEIKEESAEKEIFTNEELNEEKQKNWIFPKQIINQIRLANKMPKPREYMHMKISEKGTKETIKELNKANS